jgi:dinuclear metal center YbgI/SA1388 family protein
MIRVQDIITELEAIAPKKFQEAYDNCGLITGNEEWPISNLLVALDCTEQIIDEALEKMCNFIITHHPILFKGLKNLSGKNYIERVLIKAIKNDIAIYAIHTNLDNVKSHGVNTKIAEKLKLINTKILAPKSGQLAKVSTFAPIDNAQMIRDALFHSGAGQIGNYDQCSFNSEGTGTYKANQLANPYLGKKGELHQEREIKIEMIFPIHLKNKIIGSLLNAHPYEEVAYDIQLLENEWELLGAGMVGELESDMPIPDFLQFIKSRMQVEVIKYTPFVKNIKKVAICGGSGSFLLANAIAAQADAFISSDFKYHEFFDAENKIMVCDIGHYESEQFTPELIIEIIKNKFPNFAPILAETNTNPVNYYY